MLVPDDPLMACLREGVFYQFCPSWDDDFLFYGLSGSGEIWDIAYGLNNPPQMSSEIDGWGGLCDHVATIIDPTIIDQLKVIEAKHILKGTAPWLSRKT